MLRGLVGNMLFWFCLQGRQVNIQDAGTSLDMEPQISELLEQEAMGSYEQIWGVGAGQDQKKS